MKTTSFRTLFCLILGLSPLLQTASVKAWQGPSPRPATTVSPDHSPGLRASPEADAVAMQGRWAQPCTNGTVRTEFFQQNQVSLNEMFFADKDCRKPTVVFINDGLFRLPQTGQIDFQFTSIRLRLLTDFAVKDFNQRKVCGYETWTLLEEKEITGRSCEIFVIGFPQRIPTAGEMRYGIYQLSQNQEQLAFGKLSKDKNASTPEKRPDQFDPRVYQRVPRVRPSQYQR